MPKITKAGKTTLAMGLFGVLIVAALAMVGGYSAKLGAQNSASTAVRVLNTPPIYDDGVVITNPGFPYEVITSATATPWLNTKNYSWGANAHDTSGDHMYLLVCSSSTTPPTANSGAAPVCGGGGGNQIAVSASFFNPTNSTSSIQLYATATISTAAETIPWVAYACDDAPSNPRCTAASSGEAGQLNASPAAVTHPFEFNGLFTAITPVDPAQSVTVTASSSQMLHVDTNNGPVTAKLYICRTAVFDVSTRTCTGGFYASSTAAATTNPDAAHSFPVPTAANTYAGYTYVIDQYGYEAIGTQQGISITYTVNNVAPTVYNVAIASSTLTLTNPGGLSTSTAFEVSFNSSDNNGCLDKFSAQEMATATFQFYRNAVTCSAGGDHNDRSCYTLASSTSVWTASTTCQQTSCSSFSGSWSCSFPLWYLSDPTVGTTPFTGQAWRARVSMIDSGALSSAATTSISDSQMNQFSYFDTSSSTIAFGDFQPGDKTTTLGDNGAVLGVISKGNTSINVTMYGDDMCPDARRSGGFCSGNEALDTILAGQQRFATSTVLYAAAGSNALSSSSITQSDLKLEVPQNTTIGNFMQRVIYWGINVPGTLSISGDYKGVDTITSYTNPTTSSW